MTRSTWTKINAKHLKCLFKFVLGISFLIPCIGIELRTSVRIEVQWHNTIVRNCFVEDRKCIARCGVLKHATTHNSACAIINVGNKPLSIIKFVPVGMPHQVWQWPFVPSILPRFSALNARFLKTICNHDLADFAQRNSITFSAQNHVKLSRATTLLLPILHNNLAETRIQLFNRSATRTILQRVVPEFLERTTNVPHADATDLLCQGNLPNRSPFLQFSNDPQTFFSFSLYAIKTSPPKAE